MELRITQDTVKGRARTFLGDAVKDVHILGTNKYGAGVATWLAGKGLRMAGFVNDAVDMREYAAFPVVRSSQLPPGAAIINCIVEGRCIDARRNIAGWNVAATVDYYALQLAFPEELLEIDFLANTGTVPEDIEAYQRLHAKLADQESKDTLERLVNFRYNRDLEFMSDFRLRLAEQYFEPFVRLREGAVFIDGGGFDGATSLEFARRNPSFGHIHCFEPNDDAFQVAARNLADLANVSLVRKGLWNRPETLSFDASQGSASKLSGSGTVHIETTTIDLEVNGRVDFVKLDVEGAEFNALLGGEQVIKRNHPALAVCVYHDQRDMLRIPELVAGMHAGYKLYLRHYTQGAFETVMFFV